MTLPSFNWDDLRYFQALVTTASLAGAATSLGVNQSTVFRRLQALEQITGSRLFERKRSGYRLTPAGNLLYEKVLALNPTIEEIATDFIVDQSAPKRVRIATFAAFAEDYLPNILQKLEQHFSNIEFEISAAREASDLVERVNDIAFRSCDQPPQHLIGKSVLQKPWGLYASDAYLANHPQSIQLSNAAWYQPYRFLHYPNLQQLKAYQWLYREVPDKHIRPGANSLESVAAMCKAGLGVALLCEGIRTQGLVKLTDIPTSTESQFWLLYHPEQRNNSDIPAIVKKLQELITLSFK